MPRWRGSSEQLDRELATLEIVLALRLRRYARDVAELEREMRSLRRERARRRAKADVSNWARAEVDPTPAVSD